MKSENGWINPLSDWSTDPEEVANSITHGLGFLLGFLGAIAMTIRVLREGDAWRLLGCMIYAISLVTVYAMSTLSHRCSAPNLKRIFQMLDQGFIYVLIAATYTPISLAFLRTCPWCLFLAVMWTIAMFGLRPVGRAPCITSLVFTCPRRHLEMIRCPLRRQQSTRT